MMNMLLMMAPPNMNAAFSSEAMKNFMEGLRVLGLGMGTVIGVLFVFLLIIKLLIKIFPDKG